jgi:SMODS-associated and fused to various effectors sensor domain
MVNSAVQDRDAAYWSVEFANLVSKVNTRVRERLANGEVSHLSVFALAPQPLLVVLGSLLTDLPKADVFQLHREPSGWNWPAVRKTPAFEISEPRECHGPAALVLSLSASITHDRITSVLGDDASIWTVTIPRPNNDFTKSRGQLAAFRMEMRPLFDRIKARHGQTARLHIFPAASASIAVELGRIRMPKADMPWTIYDQVNHRGGFISAVSIP